jgi:cytoskeleton protein RodZ
MNLEQFGEELKKLRIQKEITLVDISAETRINLKFLEAIENGKYKILPQTYVRAFLREYALMIGIDPFDIMEQYDSAKLESLSGKTDASDSRQNPVVDKAEPKNLETKILNLTSFQRNAIFGILIIAIVSIVAILAYSNKDALENKPVTEVSFDHVIRENEAASFPIPDTVIDSEPPVPIVQSDSLRLEITTHDSVWISLLIDGKKGSEYLFGPNKKRTWAAKEKFSVTMGNAGGAAFHLNGKDIGFLGKRGAIVRNTIITEAYLKN